MSNEQWKWNSVTYYVDIETGEVLSKLQIGTTHYKIKEIDKQITKNHRNYEQTVTRTIGCKRTGAIQQNLWATID